MSGIDELCAIAAVCALCTALCVAIKRHNPEHALLLSLGCCAAVLVALMSAASAVKDELRELVKGADIELLGCVAKAAGACLISQFASDICGEAGQGALAASVSFAGKLACLVFSLPLLRELALLIGELIAL